jgi:hypothetical protein
MLLNTGSLQLAKQGLGLFHQPLDGIGQIGLLGQARLCAAVRLAGGKWLSEG